MRRVLVAGATGGLGRHVVEALQERDVRVRALARDPGRLAGARVDETARGDLLDPSTLRAACRGADVVVSCAGASMAMGKWRDRRSFLRVDWEGNRNLLEAARAEGAGRFVYVSLFGGGAMRDTEYADAHERFVEALRRSGLSHAVVRPTGLFGFLGEIAKMARRGRGVVIGSGEARTNPVHEADVAAVVAEAIDGGEAEVALGGPEVLTRREIVETAFRALGREPRLVHVPAGVFRAVAKGTRPLNPRIAALLAFGARVSETDSVAPARGTRRLEAYFRTFAG